MSPDELAAQKTTDEHWMRLALAEADRAAQQGDVPVGAIILDSEGDLLAEGRNRRELEADPTGHAEVDALRRASTRLKHWRIEGTLYVTLEPCLMCAGALINARIKRVVYGALDLKAGATESLYQVGADTRLNHQFEVTSGILQDECADRLRDFFKALRAQGKK